MSKMASTADQPYPYSDTQAAAMLKGALDRSDLSVRALAKQLNYKQAAVLSHMAHGRVAVPLERAVEIARAVNLPPGAFLAAAVEQRAPGTAELLREPSQSPDDRAAVGFIAQLADMVGAPLEQLNEEQKQVLREVVLEPRPRRRWLSTAELPAVLMLRQSRPQMSQEGLAGIDLERLQSALSDESSHTRR